MLVTGCVNPAGESASAGYNGLYLTDAELKDVVEHRRMLRVPVKAEHGGAGLGHVVSSYMDGDGRLHCVMHIDECSVEGAIAAGLVRDGIASELSLGYSVDVAHSADGEGLGYSVDVAHSADSEGLQAEKKEIIEVSLVRKGARENCLVTAYEDCLGTRFTRVQAGAKAGAKAVVDPWDSFDLGA
jgi:hypothetical protein